MWRMNIHYCKHCNSNFRVDLNDRTGDFFLVCPSCGWKHYRRVENGVAIHCELKNRQTEPIEL